MNKCVAVGTNRTQVLYWVELIRFADFGERNQMMNVNYSVASSSIFLEEFEATNDTTSAIMRNTGTACF